MLFKIIIIVYSFTKNKTMKKSIKTLRGGEILIHFVISTIAAMTNLWVQASVLHLPQSIAANLWKKATKTSNIFLHFCIVFFLKHQCRKGNNTIYFL